MTTFSARRLVVLGRYQKPVTECWTLFGFLGRCLYSSQGGGGARLGNKMFTISPPGLLKLSWFSLERLLSQFSMDSLRFNIGTDRTLSAVSLVEFSSSPDCFSSWDEFEEYTEFLVSFSSSGSSSLLFVSLVCSKVK